jgi:hypothetical protein
MRRFFLGTLLLFSFAHNEDVAAKASSSHSTSHSCDNFFRGCRGLHLRELQNFRGIPFKLEFQMLDPSLTPIPDSEFEVDAILVRHGKKVTLQFPLFNFQTLGDGSIIQSVNPLPRSFRPTSDQLFSCSNNDAYLQYIIRHTTFPTPISSFDLAIKKGGHLQISNNNSAIAAGGHSFNSQTVQYATKHSKKIPRTESFDQMYNLQLYDYQYFPLPSTTFAVTTEVLTQRDLVTINIPSISFTTTGDRSPENKMDNRLISGGYVGTASGSLPQKLLPTQIQTVYDITSGLNISIDTYGNLAIASANDITGVIPVGSYTTSPVTITYHRPKNNDIEIKNFIVQPAFTNISQFTDNALNDGIRDSHVNDYYKGILAWAWTDNSAQTDLSNNTIDCYVAIGKERRGKVKVADPVRLTTLPTGVGAWDTAVAINRTNPDNIVVSFGQYDYNPGGIGTLNVCVSNDGGTTWSSPINIDPSVTDFGDARGIIADRFGNFWFSTTSRNNSETVINLVFYVSSDGGNTWGIVYNTTDSTPSTGTYDYPQITVGYDGDGNYGLWFVGAFIENDGNMIARLGFIPTTGNGQFGTGSFISLNELPNTIGETSLTTSKEGSVYINSAIGDYDFVNNFYVNSLVVKSPGSLDVSLVNNVQSVINTAQNLTGTTSYPVFYQSYFIATVNNTIYDDRRNALYILYSERPTIASQDFYLCMVASFDGGVTWSKRFPIATSHNNNRGFSSVAFDRKSGSLSIGWYDSRNSPDGASEQYFGAYVSRRQLDRIVKELKKNSL